MLVLIINRVMIKDLRIKNIGVIREFYCRSLFVFRLWFKKFYVMNYKIFFVLWKYGYIEFESDCVILVCKK